MLYVIFKRYVWLFIYIVYDQILWILLLILIICCVIFYIQTKSTPDYLRYSNVLIFNPNFQFIQYLGHSYNLPCDPDDLFVFLKRDYPADYQRIRENRKHSEMVVFVTKWLVHLRIIKTKKYILVYPFLETGKILDIIPMHFQITGMNHTLISEHYETVNSGDIIEHHIKFTTMNYPPENIKTIHHNNIIYNVFHTTHDNDNLKIEIILPVMTHEQFLQLQNSNYNTFLHIINNLNIPSIVMDADHNIINITHKLYEQKLQTRDMGEINILTDLLGILRPQMLLDSTFGNFRKQLKHLLTNINSLCSTEIKLQTGKLLTLYLVPLTIDNKLFILILFYEKDDNTTELVSPKSIIQEISEQIILTNNKINIAFYNSQQEILFTNNEKLKDFHNNHQYINSLHSTDLIHTGTLINDMKFIYVKKNHLYKTQNSKDQILKICDIILRLFQNLASQFPEKFDIYINYMNFLHFNINHNISKIQCFLNDHMKLETINLNLFFDHILQTTSKVFTLKNLVIEYDQGEQFLLDYNAEKLQLMITDLFSLCFKYPSHHKGLKIMYSENKTVNFLLYGLPDGCYETINNILSDYDVKHHTIIEKDTLNSLMEF